MEGLDDNISVSIIYKLSSDLIFDLRSICGMDAEADMYKLLRQEGYSRYQEYLPFNVQVLFTYDKEEYEEYCKKHPGGAYA